MLLGGDAREKALAEILRLPARAAGRSSRQKELKVHGCRRKAPQLTGVWLYETGQSKLVRIARLTSSASLYRQHEGPGAVGEDVG